MSTKVTPFSLKNKTVIRLKRAKKRCNEIVFEVSSCKMDLIKKDNLRTRKATLAALYPFV